MLNRNEQASRLSELQAKAYLTPGETIELKHLVEMKWKGATDFKMPDMETLARAAYEAMKEKRRQEELMKRQGQ